MFKNRIVLFLLTTLFFSCDSAVSLDKNKLIGKWERPDGGYIIEITKAIDDGSLECRYLNPNPINVSQAKWRIHEGELQIYVELRDVNYPGSVYSLTYDPETDKLNGSYFQAATGQTYAVEFVKKMSILSNNQDY